MGLFSNISSSLPTIAQNAAGQVLSGQAAKYLPPGLGSKIGAISSIGSAVASGNLTAAASAVLGSGLLNKALGKGAGALASILYQSTPNELLGGLTPLMAKQIYSIARATKYARKNIFLVQIAPLRRSREEKLTGGELEGSFNFYCMEASYAPFTVTGQKNKIGSGYTDHVESGEPTEIRVVTLDDEVGTVKRFFKSRALKAAHADGTVGLPIEYLSIMRIVHAFTSNETNMGGYEDKFLVRAGSIEFDLSRRDDQMQEIQMTFVEHDTFFPI